MKRYKINWETVISWIMIPLAGLTLWIFIVYVVMHFLSKIW
ncbi:hypothetical protein M2451_003341 [Dysgonomonas sp. PFB1-18]|nr:MULTISPECIES: hypothetical protein [unclassified Dysgonomonas]MDH6310569.1 hypothetical protein [Dysgonomonas sp. PF1-14]MDH6340419.1 hypothetical protein [Dysgonomonas sp. PF1-16]MDH6382001.1 hypothetical protein [Dysgonomonas sp. PFB1-18]MDH6399390.1 hypothetical protein [Dysgonomonas sp. PF1-23]